MQAGQEIVVPFPKKNQHVIVAKHFSQKGGLRLNFAFHVWRPTTSTQRHIPTSNATDKKAAQRSQKNNQARLFF